MHDTIRTSDYDRDYEVDAELRWAEALAARYRPEHRPYVALKASYLNLEAYTPSERAIAHELLALSVRETCCNGRILKRHANIYTLLTRTKRPELGEEWRETDLTLAEASSLIDDIRGGKP